MPKFIVFLSIYSISFSQLALAQSGRSLVLEMISSAENVKTFTAEITKEERIEGEMVKQITAVKLSRNPFQLYLNQRFPKAGVEVLVRLNEEKPLINPNSFPWFNLSLDPFGPLMRKNQHHTVFDSGFDLMTNILSKEIEIIGADSSHHIFYKGLVDYEKRPSHFIEFLNPEYGTQLYRVQMGEDLIAIANKLNLSEYAILEMNPEVDFFDDVAPGDEIKVPTSYAKKMVLYIDKEYLLPLLIKVYDNSGLFEQYSYRKFVLNPRFAEDEFTADFKGYGF